MRIAIALTVLALVAVLVLSTDSHSFSRSPEAMTQEQASQAGNYFALDLYQSLKGQKGNLFFSPTSIDLALVMTWTGAGGATSRDMSETLYLTDFSSGDPESVSLAYGSLQNAIVGTDAPYTLRIANRLWGQSGYMFRSSFLDLLSRDFGAGLQTLDFEKNSEGARQTINTWVEDQTEDKIKDLLPAGSLGSNVRLVLTNAIYFLGNWQHRFQGSDTADRPFTLEGGEEIRVPTMHQTHSFSYSEDDKMQVVALPYQGGDLEMVIILPRDKDGLPALETRLNSKHLTEWTTGLERKSVRLWLPKFTLTGEFSLSKVLGQLGMGRAFGQGADFSGMSDGDDLFISDVVHKSFIDVFEKGTEAAAATAVTIRTTSMPGVDPEAVSFVADHPFLFLIRHVETGNILFLGRMADPLG